MKSARLANSPRFSFGTCWYCANPLGNKHAVLTSPDGHKLVVHRICATPAGQLLKYPLKETT